MTDQPAASWRPTGLACSLPPSTENVWKRLMELSRLTWPTAAEQLERRMLEEWLNPARLYPITDTKVLDVACEVAGISQSSDEEFLLPSYAVASEVWAHLTRIASGDELEPARAEYTYECAEQWQERRRQQGLDWWSTVMQELERLLRMQVFYASELPELTTCHEYARAMRRHALLPVFDGPLAIGASLYDEPITPGTGFGFDEGALHVMESLAFAVHSCVGAWKQLADTEATEEQRTTAIMRADLFASLLKGYTWAAAHYRDGMSLAGWLVNHPDVWESAKAALLDGREAVNSNAVDGKRPIGFGRPRYERFKAIATTTTEDLIAKMEVEIEKERRFHEAIRSSR